MEDQSGQARSAPSSSGRGAHEIYKALRAQIGTVYASGAPLPSTRALAVELGVSRSTVTAAYEQLVAEGYIEVRHGARARASGPLVEVEQKTASVAGSAKSNPKSSPKGSAKPRLSHYGERLAALAPIAVPRDNDLFADFRYGDLYAPDFPRTAWKRAIATVAGQQPAHLVYADPSGSVALRRAVQGLLWRNRGIRCALDQILIVSGSQQGLDLCGRILLNPGDRFVIENPGYASARKAFAAIGAQAVPVPVDQDGIDTRLLHGVAAKLAYVTPSHQFPLGGILPIHRRRQLLDWARSQGAYVLEDDYDSEYRYNIKPIPPLHGLDGASNVIYLGTISKTLSPTLRVGYLIAPPELVPPLVAAKRLADCHSTLLVQEALALLIESGFYERHVRRMRRASEERRTALLNALRLHLGDRVSIEGTEAGLHLVIWLRDLPKVHEAAVVQAARRLGVGIYPVSLSYDGQSPALPDRVGLVLGYGGLPVARIARGVELLAEAIGQMTGRT